MPGLSVSRTINAPLARVWEVFTDLSTAAERLSAVERIEMLSDQPFGEGTRWRETRTMFGKSATEEMWITSVDTMHSYVAEAESRGTHYESRFDFTSVDDSTTLVTMTFSGEGTGAMKVVGAVFWPFLKGRMAKDLSKDLDDLAQSCETSNRAS